MVESKVISHGKMRTFAFFGEKKIRVVCQSSFAHLVKFFKNNSNTCTVGDIRMPKMSKTCPFGKKNLQIVYFHFIFLHPLHFSVFLKWPLLLSFRYTSSLSEINALQQVITLVVYKLGCLSSEIGRWKLGGLDKSFALCIIFILCMCIHGT